MAEITEGEWKAELERLAEAWRTSGRAEGLTGPEWSRKLGINIIRTRALLLEAKSRGLLLMGTAVREALDGRWSKVTVYAMRKSPVAKPATRAARRRGSGF